LSPGLLLDIPAVLSSLLSYPLIVEGYQLVKGLFFEIDQLVVIVESGLHELVSLPG